MKRSNTGKYCPMGVVDCRMVSVVTVLPCGRDERGWDGATAVATGERGPPEIAISGIEGAHSARDDLSSGLPSSLRLGEWIRSGALGRPVAAGPRSRLHMCPALSGALMQATAPDSPHHAWGDEGGGDARRVVPLLAEIWFTRRPPAMLAGGSSGFGPLALLYAARPSPSLPPRVVVVVKAGVGLGVGVSRGSRCGRGIGGGGDDDGWRAVSPNVDGQSTAAPAPVPVQMPGRNAGDNPRAAPLAPHGRRAANQLHAVHSQGMGSDAAARQRSLTLAKHPCTTDSPPLSCYS
ncbi:hypothetical protein COCCADRAFT_27251 [Bipolaris zeicola 26-R-13]|uniref:Uncharacterized protein n=1 Tax=Cochliobolus carbonum (strain 26-R-13) TaxID=930089 RepID=W6XXK4_COCC2|nr:uncharacterized protein COCCADRAFT_27251 [Bipolaris zeicola 26-R-13]EUC32167.1 hypothetical protein COCCADRAFT_27251 [Bipolaris zeicola 26-R-13]